MSPQSPTFDFRSDTCTRPTPEMRRAIADADVGDDVYGEDPSVNRLEAMAAEITHKEAAIFVATGTMANQLALLVWTRPGDEVLIHEDGHCIHHEAGGAGANAGVNLRPVPGSHGAIEPSILGSYIRSIDNYHARTSLLTIENTANLSGGLVVSHQRMEALYAAAADAGLPVHLDGARIFNAAVATKSSVESFTRYSDTVSFCISKGLGGPVGSLLCGSADAIAKARHQRHRLGGGWRQAGILAAAGIYALENHVERLSDDHERAQNLAEKIAATGAYTLDFPVETNILYVSAVHEYAPTGPELEKALAEKGILTNATSPNQIRLVTHLDLDDDAISYTARTFNEITAALS